MIHVYAQDAIFTDAGAGTWGLARGFDPAKHRMQLKVVGGDPVNRTDHPDGSAPQGPAVTVRVDDLHGSPLTTGHIVRASSFSVRSANGKRILIDRIEAAGQTVGYVASSPLVAGVDYSIQGPIAATSNRRITSVPALCGFGPGTMIRTIEGDVPVEWLSPGQRVVTRDHGAQSVLWVGRTAIAATQIAADANRAPIVIEEGSFGPQAPDFPLVLAGPHRVLVGGPEVELHFAVPEAFSAVVDLVDHTGIHPENTAQDIVYTQILLAGHEVIQANGIWVESLFLEDAFRMEILATLPVDMRLRHGANPDHAETARMCLNQHEGRLLARLTGQAPTMQRLWVA